MTIVYWRPRSDCNKNNSFKRRFPVQTRRSTVSQLLLRTAWLLLPTITAASPWMVGPPETRQKESSGHTPWRNICKRYAIRTCIGLIFERSSRPIEVLLALLTLVRTFQVGQKVDSLLQHPDTPNTLKLEGFSNILYLEWKKSFIPTFPGADVKAISCRAVNMMYSRIAREGVGVEEPPPEAK